MEYTRLLKRYMVGDDVMAVKQKLVELKYLASATHNRYGNDTYRAVKAFQEANNLESDGKVGPYTWAALFATGGEGTTPTAAVTVNIPDWIGKAKATLIGADLAKVTETRRKVCLEALKWAIDPNQPGDHMRCFYVRGGNLYDTSLQPNYMSDAKLKKYFSKTAYAPYYDGGRQEIMEEQAKANSHLIAGADCSGTVVGVWRYIRVKSPNFDASANGLYNSFCTQTNDPQPGDLAWRNGHIGLYVGGGYIVENIGGAYGCQLTKKTNRQCYNFQDGKLHKMSAWTAFGDPKCY